MSNVDCGPGTWRRLGLVVEEAGGVVEGVAHDEPTELLTMAAARGLADVFRAELRRLRVRRLADAAMAADALNPRSFTRRSPGNLSDLAKGSASGKRVFRHVGAPMWAVDRSGP